MSEINKNPFPEMHILPSPLQALKRVGAFIGDVLINRHSIPNTGGGPAIDSYMLSDREGEAIGEIPEDLWG